LYVQYRILIYSKRQNGERCDCKGSCDVEGSGLSWHYVRQDKDIFYLLDFSIVSFTSSKIFVASQAVSDSF
jgi:hypothetical protein